MPRQPARAREVADTIKREISDGEIGDGGWLPSKPTLAKKYDVTVGTVQRALTMLADRGTVDLAPGRSAMVRPPAMHRDSADVTRQVGAWRGFPLSVRTAGGEPYSDTSGQDVEATANVAQWLAVPVGTAVLERDRTQGRMVDDERQPIQVAVTWFAPSLVTQIPVLRQLDTGPGGSTRG